MDKHKRKEKMKALSAHLVKVKIYLFQKTTMTVTDLCNGNLLG